MRLSLVPVCMYLCLRGRLIITSSGFVLCILFLFYQFQCKTLLSIWNITPQLWRNCQIEDISFEGKIFIDPWNLLKIQHAGVWFFRCITNSFNACLFVCESQEEVSEFSRSPTQGEWRRLDGVKESQTGREVPWSFAWQVNELCHCIFVSTYFIFTWGTTNWNKQDICLQSRSKC